MYGETLNSKKHESTPRKIAKTFAAAVAVGSMLAACSSGKSSEATNNKAPAHSANPTPNTNPANNTQPTTTTPNTSPANAPTQANSSVGTPIANLCSVPAINDYAVQVLGPYSASCKDTFSAGNPFAEATANWSQNSTTSLFVQVTPNDQTQSAQYYPANSNMWNYDLSQTTVLSGEQILPNEINNQPAIWQNNQNYSYEGLLFKYGHYVIVAGGGNTNTTQADFTKLVELVVETGFSK